MLSLLLLRTKIALAVHEAPTIQSCGNNLCPLPEHGYTLAAAFWLSKTLKLACEIFSCMSFPENEFISLKPKFLYVYFMLMQGVLASYPFVLFA